MNSGTNEKKYKGVRTGSWIEIDLDAVGENYETIRSIVGDETKVCAVVKADAYGHGVKEITRFLDKKGADYFAVAVLDEAIELRKMGIEKPILILGPMLPGQSSYVLRYDLIQTICSLEMAEELSEEAIKQKKNAKIHVKVDTGMGRIGMASEDAPEIIGKINQLPGIFIEGIFTHFATADDEDKAYVYDQWTTFNQLISQLKRDGINIPISHVATSATIIDTPFMKMDMVRPGLMLYGLYPRSSMREKIELKPALTLKSRISYLKTMKKLQSISYGRKYFAEAGEEIATLPIGYYDGFRRLLTNNCDVLAGGKRCPVVGTVCMDHVLVKLDKELGIERFDEVVLIGQQGKEEIAADEIADRLQTINYEVVSSLSRRLPRLYSYKGRLVGVRNLLGAHSRESASEQQNYLQADTPWMSDTCEIALHPQALEKIEA